MSIFVSKDGNQIGPYTPQSLWEALASGKLAGNDTAWVEGGDTISTVGQLVRAPASASSGPLPTSIGTGIPTIPENRPRPMPAAPTAGLTAPPTAGLTAPPTAALTATPTAIPVAPSEPSIDYALPEVPDPFPIERFRFIGAATPLVILLIMLVPWAVDLRFFGYGSLNGYSMFSYMPFPALIFAVAAGGIGLYGFQGASEGDIRNPLLAIGCSLFAIATLAYLTGYLTRSVYTPLFESGDAVLRSGWHLTMATILLGTAGAIIPSSEFENSAKIGSWVVSGLFAIAAIIFVLLGFNVS